MKKTSKSFIIIELSICTYKAKVFNGIYCYFKEDEALELNLIMN